MRTQTIYTAEPRLDVVCPECGWKKQWTPPERSYGKTVLVKCRCGARFQIIPERRRHFRKPVRLAGKLSLDGQRFDLDILIKDLSRTGLRFEIVGKVPDLNPGDIVHVRFRLDDVLIERAVSVRHAAGGRVGGELLPGNGDKAIGFFLMD